MLLRSSDYKFQRFLDHLLSILSLVGFTLKIKDNSRIHAVQKPLKIIENRIEFSVFKMADQQGIETCF
jgi:hypothetical protein